MSNKPLMKCGHTANAHDSNGNPVCVLCANIRDGWDEVEDKRPSLVGREARCAFCGRKTESEWDLPFFTYEPEQDYDEYYCGCRGWD